MTLRLRFTFGLRSVSKSRWRFSIMAIRHRRSATDGLVNAAEVVIGEVESEGRFQVLPLLTKAVRQPREPPHRHSDIEVLTFDV